MFTRSKVSPEARARMNELMKNLDEEKRVTAEKQKREDKERKEQRKMEIAAETLMSLSKIPHTKPEPVNHRPVTRSCKHCDELLDFCKDLARDTQILSARIRELS